MGSDRQYRTLVIGLGATGLAAARYLTGLGECVLVIDSRANPPGLEALRSTHPDIPVELETLDPRWLEGASRVVLSPGLDVGIAIASEARRRGIELLSDIELFSRAARAQVLAVTGSNGKSTVTTLTARMLAAAGVKALAGGNLGPPALDLLDSSRASGAAPIAVTASDATGAMDTSDGTGATRATDTPDAYVLEISSFQMETTDSLRPLAAAVLNVSADHLDRHGSLEQYGALKAKLLRAADYAVYNRDDSLVRKMGETCARPIPFSIETPLEQGWSIVESGGHRYIARNRQPLLPTSALLLHGMHNESNALAALALTALFIETAGMKPDEELAALAAAIAELKRFPGLPHRCQSVAEKAGVKYIDDSKGTNVGATIAALAGLAGPLVLIAGGVGKGASFEPLAAAARGKVKAVVLIGEAAEQMEAAFADVCPTRRAEDMPGAVRAAAEAATAGDTVLLSPACSSLDMFRDYRHRGEAFAEAVEGLPA